MEDLPTIRRACQPIACWWDDYLATGQADPDRLDDALAEARALGALSGRLGEALAYIIAGCLPDLNYTDAAAAFDRVAAIGRGASLQAADNITGPQPPPARAAAQRVTATTVPGEQLAFPGIAGAGPAATKKRSTQ
jgi:hypothetical protein